MAAQKKQDKPLTGRVERGKWHDYYIDGVKVPGVTTLLNKGLPKPALVKWAARTVANEAINDWDALADLPVSERYERLYSAPDRDRDAAANRGTEVHKLAASYVAGEEITIPEVLAGHVQSYQKFVDDWQVEPLMLETPVFSRRHMYGGSFDMIGRLRGVTGLWDIKTNRSGAFGDTAFQLAAYSHADFWIDPDGAEQPLPHVDQHGVIWVRADGYSIYPYRADDWVFRQFLYIQQTAGAADASKGYVGAELITP